MDEKELILFLEAVKESTNNNESDLEEVRSELEVFKSQLMRLSKKYNESIQKQKKQEEMIEKIRTEKMQLKKELINANYERKNFESQLANQIDEVKRVKSELKAKGSMIIALENCRRKLEVELSKSGHRSAPCPRMSRSRNNSGNSQNSGVFRQRSFSVDRLHEQNKTLGRQLLKSGQSSAYTLSKKGTKKVVSRVTPEPDADFEKVILLQKLLLQKTKILAEKEVRIEELEKTNAALSLGVSRLKATRHLAQELTDTRHKLALKSNLLEEMRKEMEEGKSEVNRLRLETARLRERLHEVYSDKLSLFSVHLGSNRN